MIQHQHGTTNAFIIYRILNGVCMCYCVHDLIINQDQRCETHTRQRMYAMPIWHSKHAPVSMLMAPRPRGQPCKSIRQKPYAPKHEGLLTQITEHSHTHTRFRTIANRTLATSPTQPHTNEPPKTTERVYACVCRKNVPLEI